MSLLFPPHRGVGPGCNTREIAHKLIELKADIEDLEQREQELEQQKMWVQQSIKNVTEDVQNNRYPLASCLFLWAGRQCCWWTCTERVRRQSPSFGGGGALPSLGAASSAGQWIPCAPVVVTWLFEVPWHCNVCRERTASV